MFVIFLQKSCVSENGVLYNSVKNTLMQYPIGSTAASFTFPSTVTQINWFAFDTCRYLTSVTLSQNLTWIGGYAFHDCTNLTSITIPESLIYGFGEYAFDGCTSLTTVTIDSPNVTAMLTSQTSASYLIQNATVVYVSENAAASLPAEFSILYTETATDITGYRKYDVLQNKNAEK